MNPVLLGCKLEMPVGGSQYCWADREERGHRVPAPTRTAFGCRPARVQCPVVFCAKTLLLSSATQLPLPCDTHTTNPTSEVEMQVNGFLEGKKTKRLEMLHIR